MKAEPITFAVHMQKKLEPLDQMSGDESPEDRRLKNRSLRAATMLAGQRGAMTTPQRGYQTMVSSHGIKHFLPLRESAQLLTPWMEATGALHHLTTDEGVLLAEIGPCVVALPVDLDPKLRPLLGQRIGILRTDSLTKPYRIRLVRK